MNIYNKKLCEKANQITLNLLAYGHAKISTEWKGKALNTAFSYLYYVYKGHCTLISENKTIELTAGNWYLIPSGYNFRGSCEDYMEDIYFHIQLSGTDNLDILRHIKEPLAMSEPTVPRVLFEYVRKPDDILSILTVKNKVYEILARILTENHISIEQPIHSECVLNAISYISAHLSASLTTTEIAENSYVSKSKLTKQFRKELSMSIQEYLYNILLSEASKLVLNTNLSFGEISERLGFSDQFYFSKKFKEKYGISPRKYRNQLPLST